MIDRVLAAAGIDPVQWRALTGAYLRMDLRRGAGAVRPREQSSRFRGSPLTGLLFVTAFTSLMLSLLAWTLEDVMMFATILTTYGALNTAMLLLVDFTGIVVSPDDYRVLGSRPVGSRTFFAARLAAILVYVVALGIALAAFPALALWVVRGLGFATFAATFAAVVLCDMCTAVLVIGGYAALLGRVHPRRLTRALSYLQLLASMLFLGGYYLATLAFEQSRLRQLSFAELRWLWLDPASWFAALVAIAGGTAGQIEWLAAVAAITLTIGCVPLASGRLSLEYAERLAEIGATSESAGGGRSLMTRVPGFARHEAHAVALLVRAQFRYDNRFRLAVLSILPLTVFYILLGLRSEALADPFSGEPGGGAGPLYFAVVFLPMTLHASLRVSDSWRAAWIFFAAPADPARLIVAAKNFVSVWFIGGYLAGLAIFWSFFYDRVWHAFVHALVIGLLAHLLLQAAVILRPEIPFAAEPRQAQRTSQLWLLFLVAGVIGGFIPIALPFVYARGSWTMGMLVLLAGVTAAAEYAVRLRAREAIMEMEFRG